MLKITNFLILISIIIISLSANAQQDTINPNGYNIFYYPNHFKLSEGNLKNGKPDGYWLTYYVNGNKKSEGNRKNFLLDSVWVFYFEDGDTSEVINYLNDKKNGFYYKYEKIDNKLSLISKELYVNDQRQGFSFYYFPSGELQNKINYVDNYKHGKGYEYSEDGRLIAIEEYRYNNIVGRQTVNRFDRNNHRTGRWVDVFDNGKVKTEINYVSGLPNGNSKEYSPTGKILKIDKYENGKIVESVKKTKLDTLSSANIRVEKDYYANKKLKSLRTYKDSLCFGIHIFYNADGSIQKAISYDEFGIKNAEGQLDTNSNKIGNWTYYFQDGSVKSKGAYKNNKKEGKWQYFFKNGNVEQEGVFEDGYFEGTWTWYYENKNILREENYYFGNRDGSMYELSIEGDTIVKGSFVEGDKDGIWSYTVGDEFTQGKYNYGMKSGLWETYYYPEMKIKEIVNYSEDLKTGKYKEYYLNKKVKSEGKYRGDEKNGKWTVYYPNGSVNYTAVYNSNNIIKINDEPVK